VLAYKLGFEIDNVLVGGVQNDAYLSGFSVILCAKNKLSTATLAEN
jgi:hypothetical protein